MKKYVYIAGPYTKGDVVKNVRRVVLVADRLRDVGFVPFVPHLTFVWHLVSPHEIDFWYQYDLAWLEKCDCLLRLEGESSGADNEVRFAEEHNIPVYYDVDTLLLESTKSV